MGVDKTDGGELVKVLFLLLFLAVPARAQWAGKLDLHEDPSAIGLRELHDGNWLAGLEHGVAHVEYNGFRLAHVKFFTAWRAMELDAAYGLSAGVNVGGAGAYLATYLPDFFPAIRTVKFVSMLGNWTSLDFYGGYRPLHGSDTHAWIYGIGGRVRIPLSLSAGL